MLKKLIQLSLSLMAVSTATLLAGGDAWMTDFEAAQEKAKTENKQLLLEFTGSDWCPPCKMMQKNFFGRDEWVKRASEDFVLVCLDFPNDKSKMDEKTIKQNDELAARYGIEGYPTVILTDPSGKPYASSGFFEGSIEAYAATLKLEAEKGQAQIERIEAAKKMEDGPAKAIRLQVLISDQSPAILDEFYADAIQAIKQADPENEFVKEHKEQAAFAKMEQQLNELFQAEQFDQALAHVAAYEKEQSPSGERLQQVRFIQAILTARSGDAEQAKKIAKEGVAINPESQFVAQLQMIAERADAIADQAKAQQDAETGEEEAEAAQD